MLWILYAILNGKALRRRYQWRIEEVRICRLMIAYNEKQIRLHPQVEWIYIPLRREWQSRLQGLEGRA